MRKHMGSVVNRLILLRDRLAPWLVGLAGRARPRHDLTMRDDEKDAVERSRDVAGRLIESQELERTRIARDLHDGVCQEMAALSVDLSHLRQMRGDLQGAAVQERILSIQRRTATLAESLRLISHGLHPSVLQHIGLVAALESQCAEIERQHHVRVTFSADGEIEPASGSVALSIFRIAQEALGNAAKHGHARHATVSLAREDADFALCVADDGGGFDVVAARRNGGLGLVSMEERARFVHGKVSIRSQPGAGTLVVVRIPAAAVDDARGPEADAHHPGSLRDAGATPRSHVREEPCDVQPCC